MEPNRKPTANEIDYLVASMEQGISQHYRHDGYLIGAMIGNGTMSIALYNKVMERKGTWIFYLD